MGCEPAVAELEKRGAGAVAATVPAGMWAGVFPRCNVAGRLDRDEHVPGPSMRLAIEITITDFSVDAFLLKWTYIVGNIPSKQENDMSPSLSSRRRDDAVRFSSSRSAKGR
jgi:hypothetical protein